ncbi:TlpA disulfide reductase family protein [uncultured Alistipes sp.]|jgi:Peroxiredoxin|uniref:TlpA disulfide reductase family protein n=1 Tax=uncultured Alistipes sp. TaxID=538949 RepID=UPI0025F68DF7|nr:TlpA disulfide reductase family protein [uncultured Alistipes sp.]
MKRVLWIFIAVVACFGCGPNYTVTGHYDLAPGDSVYLFDNDYTILAQGIVDADSTFTLKGRISTPDVVILAGGESASAPVELILERGTIHIEEGAPGRYTASNTPLNDSLSLLDKKLRDLYIEHLNMPSGLPPEEVSAQLNSAVQLRQSMIEANLDNVLGLHLFRQNVFPDVLENPELLSETELRMNAFPRKMRSHRIMQEMRLEISAIRQADVGRLFTDLALKNTEGETIALSSLVSPGRWVLLYFWITWWSPSMNEMPHLRKAYADYKDRGFEIYAVSLDNDIERWEKVVGEDHMPWVNVLGVSNDKQSEAASIYCVRTIPANFLISPEGKIAAKNLYGEALQAKLAEVIK